MAYVSPGRMASSLSGLKPNFGRARRVTLAK
jgi:hypothetical protein